MRQYPKLPACTRAEIYQRSSPGVEDEVGDLLYALVRMAKPLKCIETGALYGDSAMRIGEALRANNLVGSSLVTCEIDPDKVDMVRARVQGRNLWVEVRQMKGTELIASLESPADFVFIDSGSPEVRLEEIKLLDTHNVAPLGIVAMHDACKDYEILYEWFSDHRNWPHLVFPGYVGIAVFQRPA